jgi:hypothetical protein
VHTHLKGRIVRVDGTSYLILQENGENPDLVQVKSLDAKRQIVQMRASVIESLLPWPSTSTLAAAGNL